MAQLSEVECDVVAYCDVYKQPVTQISTKQFAALVVVSVLRQRKRKRIEFLRLKCM